MVKSIKTENHEIKDEDILRVARIGDKILVKSKSLERSYRIVRSGDTFEKRDKDNNVLNV